LQDCQGARLVVFRWFLTTIGHGPGSARNHVSKTESVLGLSAVADSYGELAGLPVNLPNDTQDKPEIRVMAFIE